ncbi:GDP-mannose-dependent alpha-(1-6)-phosphatidylinositol monomannoside mannosyltransferase [Planctomycetes bacterium MalM25]|nr:GDP-mannose-dependent alpha-(1-6)-phosphatidylinositol monomannoside mannosyltransferase [Planctomycetes bacterium MalM25]
MRLVHGIPSLDPAGGGPPVVVASLAAAQAAAGAEVTIAHGSAPGSEDRVAQLLKSTPGSEAVRVVHGPFEVGASEAKPDLLCLHGFWEPWLYAASQTAKQQGLPYALTPHGMLHPWSLSQKWLKKKVGMWLRYGAMLRGSLFVHALNRQEEQFIRDLDRSAEIEVIPNGVYPESFQGPEDPGAFRRRHPSIGDAPLALFISRLHFKKGLDILAEAFAIALESAPELRLAVVGPDDGYEAEFRSHLDRRGAASAVVMPGPLYGDDKLAALRDADCFCLPSRQEGFSIAISEALACGTPCVVSHDCNYPEITEAGAGVETSLDPQEVAKALLAVLSDRERAAQMGRAGREMVFERFTWPKIAERALAISRAALAEAESPA